MTRKTWPKGVKNIYIFTSTIVLVFILFGVRQAFAISTSSVNLQGKIVRNDTGHEGLNVTPGNPPCVIAGAGNDTCDFRVRYYNAPSGGTLLLTEEFSNKEIGQYNGAFNLSLGTDSSPTAGTYSSLSALINGEDAVYIEIGFAPGGNNSYTEVFTRMPLQASPYAIRSKYASEASNVSWSGITNPEDNQSLTMGTHNTVWDWSTGLFSSNWDSNAGANNLFSLNTGNITGTGSLLNVQTGSSATISPLRVRAGSSEAIFVDNQGRVGLGTTSPLAKLDVAGDINVSSGQGFRINNTATSGQYLRGDGTRFVSSTIQSTDLPGSFSGFASPTATVGLTATNGSATTAMRSDAAPALSQAIVPTWTGLHTFTSGATIRGLTVDHATATRDKIAISVANLGSNSYIGTITNADLTAARTWTLPDATGTLALTSSLYGSWTIKDSSSDTGESVGSGQDVQILGGTNVTTSRSGRNITISATDTNTATAADDILKGSNIGTEIKYSPYTTNEAANVRFYTSSNNPTGTGRLNIGAHFHSTRLYAGNGTSALPSLSFSADTNTGIFGTGSDVLGFSTAGSERMRIAANGNVGIGTTAPNDILTVIKNIEASAYTGISFQDTSTTNSKVILGRAWGETYGVTRGGTGDLFLGAANANASNGAYIILQRTVGGGHILIDGGNVGIGTTTPSGRLHSYISNSAVTTHQYTGYFQNLATNTTTNGINKYGIYITSTGNFVGSTGTATNNYGLYVATPTGADNNYSAIFAGGNVGIGTATPIAQLDVSGTFATKMGATVSASTQIPVFVSDPSTNSQIMYTRTPAQLRSDIGAGTGTVEGTGILDYVARWTNASTIGTGVLYDNGTNVGVGTITPGAKLEVLGNGNTSATSTMILKNSDDVVLLDVKDNKEIRIADNATQLHFYRSTATVATSPRIKFSGNNVGNLEVYGEQNKVVFSGGGISVLSQGIGIASGNLNFGSQRGSASAPLITASNGFGGGIFFTGSSGTGGVAFSIDATEKMRIDTTGNVGIGDTSPASLLTVGSGDLFQVNSSGDLIKIKNVTYSWPSTNATTDGQVLTSTTGGVLSWQSVTSGVSSVSSGDTTLTISPTTGAVKASLNLSNANTWTGAQAFTGGATIRGLTVDHATATRDKIAISVADAGSTSYTGTITNADLTGARTWTLPNVTGTIALTSDIPVSDNYQYWTLQANGAGGSNITSLSSVSFNGAGIVSTSRSSNVITITGTEADTLALVTGRGATTSTASSFTGGATIRGLTVDHATATRDKIAISVADAGSTSYTGTITNADLTGARTWTLPNATGTIALTSDISTYSEITEAEIDSTIDYTGRLITGRRAQYLLRNTVTGSTTANFATGATSSTNTKTVNLGTGGVTGSTTNVNIGSTIAGSTTVNSPALSMRAAPTVSASTQIPVFISDPSTSSQIMYTRTPAQLRSDIGAVGGTGTEHYVARWTATAGVLGTGVLYDNGTNVGVGTTTPAAKLDVAGTFGTGTTAQRITNTTAANINNIAQVGFALNRTTGGLTEVAQIRGLITDIGNTSYKGALAFLTSTNNAAPTEKMRIAANGNVGIGTTAPTEKLDVNGSARIRTISNATGNILTVSTTGVVQQRTPAELLGDIGAGTVGGTGTEHYVARWTATAGVLGTGLLYDTGANVGIGTTTLGSRLVVKGSGNTSATSSLNIINSSDTSLLFVRNDGNVGIGTTTPGAMLEIAGGSSTISNSAGNITILPASGLLDIDGQVRIREGNPGLGKVLTSSADGTATWETPASVGAKWNTISSPDGNQSLSMGGHNTSWTWSTGLFNSNWTANAGTNNLFSLTTANGTTASTGALMYLGTGTSSTVNPLRIVAGGVEALFVSKPTLGDGKNSRVGLGTMSPDAMLDIRLHVDEVSTDFLSMWNGGTQFFRFEKEGTLLIGTDTSATGVVLTNKFYRKNSQLYWSGNTLWMDGGNSISSGSGVLGTTTNNSLQFKTNNLDRMIITNGGNVGIGTTAPSSLFSVGASSQFQINSSGDIVKLKNLIYSWPLSHTTNGILMNNGSGGLSWTTSAGLGLVSGTGSAGQISYWSGTTSITGSNSFWWDSTNNRLGIGTNNPQASLSVNGLVYQTGLNGSTYFGENAGRVDDLSSNNNTGIGYNSLYSNTTGYYNTALGFYSLYSNTTGTRNTGIGYNSLFSNTTGSYNTALGFYSLYSNTTGSFNTALGYFAGMYQADGSTALTDPENSIYIGHFARGKDNNDNNSIVIGYNAVGLGANTVVLGNDSIVTTALKGNVGIGTTSPRTKFQINGSAITTSNDTVLQNLQILQLPGTGGNRNNVSAGFSINSFEGNNINGRGSLHIMVSGSPGSGNVWGSIPDVDVMTLNGNGNVGIGTATPSAKLDVLGDTILSGDYKLYLRGTNRYIGSGRNNDFSIVNNASTWLRIGSANGIAIWGTSGADTNDVPHIFINTSGYVGVGTSTPQMKLEINGVKNENSSKLRFVGSKTEAGWIGTDATPALVINATYSDIRTFSNGNTWMRSNNNFYMDLDDNNDGTNFFHIRNGSDEIVFNVSESGYTGIGVTGQTYRLQLPNTADNAGKGQANAWVTYSDISLKENIQTISGGLNKIMALRGVTFDWKGQGVASSGFIAQEVEPIIPDLVSTDSNGIKSLDYGRFTPYLVEAIKEQQQIINVLGSKVNSLEQSTNLNNIFTVQSPNTLVVDSHIVPNTNNTYNIGNSTKRWKNIYTQGVISIGANGNSGGVKYDTETKELQFSNDGSNWLALGSTTNEVTLSAQYPGSITTSNQIETGVGDDLSGFMHYYELNNIEEESVSAEIRVRYTLPSNFASWTNDAIRLSYVTEGIDDDSSVDIEVFKQDTPNTKGHSLDNVSSVAEEWTSILLSGNQLSNTCTEPGDVCIVVIRLHSKDDSYVRVGDIKFNYNRKL